MIADAPPVPLDTSSIVHECAPKVAESTMLTLIALESGNNPFAININDSKKTAPSFSTKNQAIAYANKLIEDGYNFDAGLAQINVKNFKWLGINTSNVFDPCENIKASERVLVKCYEKAASENLGEQLTLRKALSCYNTGDTYKGIQNGYVSKIEKKAGVVVPDIYNIEQVKNPILNKTSSNEIIDNDGFSNPTLDGFSQSIQEQRSQE